MISKVFCNILITLGQFQSLEILDLSMAKDEKVNFAVTCGLYYKTRDDRN
jgi:hypothetical protein